MSGEFELVRKRVGEQVMRRSAWVLAGDSNELDPVVLDRADHRLLSRVPPLIVENAVAVRVSAGR